MSYVCLSTRHAWISYRLVTWHGLITSRKPDSWDVSSKCVQKNKMAAWMFPSTIKRRRILRPFISHSSRPLVSDNGDRLRWKRGNKMLPLGGHRPSFCDLCAFSTKLLSSIRIKRAGSWGLIFIFSKTDKTWKVLFCPEIPDIRKSIVSLLRCFEPSRWHH